MTYEKIFADVKKVYLKADKSKLNDDFAFQFNITGDGEGIFYVAFRGGILEVAPYDYVDRNATLFASGENFIKLANAKFTLDEAYKTGQIYVEGDFKLALELDKLALVPTEKKPKKEATPKAKKENFTYKE
ncbi:MAG: SCP2 sterol-binding domain-containing protein [Oscillospiraceae bacterium]|nr:SCP2 sterol-binding domain-containing protein [Oscillospiraceae bacterium]